MHNYPKHLRNAVLDLEALIDGLVTQRELTDSIKDCDEINNQIIDAETQYKSYTGHFYKASCKAQKIPYTGAP